MTLIAITTNFNYPVMVGDILSTSDTIDKEISIPIFLKSVNNLLPQEQKFMPLKLRQKIYIINGLLSIALAGLEYEMKFFLIEMRNYFNYKETTLANLEDFLNSFDYQEVANSSAIMLLADKNETGTMMHYRFFGNTKVQNVPYYETIIASGNGSEDFISEADFEGKMSSGENPLYDAIARNYLLLARVLLNERTTLETISNYWGAGFEMIYFNGNEFVKMDDITYVFWNGNLNLDTGQYEVAPNTILNFKYYDEVLAITATNGAQTEGYGVLPITMTAEDVDMSRMPTKAHINGKRTCSIFFLNLSNGKTISPAFYTERPENPAEVSFDSGIPEELSDLFPDGKAYDVGLIAVWFNNGRLSTFIQQEIQDTIMENIRQTALSIPE